MTWNIKNGGRGRLDAIAAVIDRERPDVLALQELRGLDRSFPGRVGMTAHVAVSVFGQPVAVLVRSPLRIVAARSVRWRLHHAAAVVRLDNSPTSPLTVVSAHLNPFSPYRRMREARWLAARFGAKHRPVLLAGDLNSLDPDTDHTDEVARLAADFRRRHLTADGTVDTRAIAAFTGGRFTDLWAAVGEGDGNTAPTSLGSAEFSGMRLDYLMASPPVAARAVRARVVRGGPAEYASDHYPVLADLQ